jgi:hypothetical protein
MPVESKTTGTLNQTTNLCTGKVLCQCCQLLNVNVRINDVVFLHFACMNLQDLASTKLVGKRNLHVHFKTARAEKRLVYHVHTVGHANDQDVV